MSWKTPTDHHTEAPYGRRSILCQEETYRRIHHTSYAILILFIALLGLGGCALGEQLSTHSTDIGQQTGHASGVGGSYTNIDAVELAVMLEGKDVTLINVLASPSPYIEGTGLFIPLSRLEAELPQSIPDRSTTVVVYCRSGNTSASAAQRLVKLGYTDIWNLEGGMSNWARAGYPLLR